MMRRNGFLIGFVMALPTWALAFNPPEDRDGPLSVKIAAPGEVTELEKPFPVSVILQNTGEHPLGGSLRVWVIDEWRIEGGRETQVPFTLAAKSDLTLKFGVTAGKGSHAALYPIHAQATTDALRPHAIHLLEVTQKAIRDAAPPKVLPTLNLHRALRLDGADLFRPRLRVAGGEWRELAVGWQGSDAATGASVSIQAADRGGRKSAFAVHPCWKQGWGEVALEYRVALPEQTPIRLSFASAIRDSHPGEPLSDGVSFEVFVGDGDILTKVFDRFSASRQWEDAKVDLSSYAGKTVTLRLLAGPGPKHNTTCDQAFFGGPILEVVPEGPSPWTVPVSERRRQAELLARAALSEPTSQMGKGLDPRQSKSSADKNREGMRWRITGGAGTFGVGLAWDGSGIVGAEMAITDGTRILFLHGYDVEVDGLAIGSLAGARISKMTATRSEDGGELELRHVLEVDDRNIEMSCRMRVEKGAFRVTFSMPGVKRNEEGSPRFTKLAPGSASESATRIYAGFGNVIEHPGSFEIRASGFHLSTRHVGADFANGLSLLQATDGFPDAYVIHPDTNTYSLVAHHDATFSLIPSTGGAFAAARLYRDLAGFRVAGGVEKLRGKMCLDQWGGDYRKAAEDLEQAARYGIADAIFVKHVWQRWGYDYRLPEIYPPAGNEKDFLAMVAACRKAGILFVPHDNYIDFYPDAEGFTYDRILFNSDGTPQKAWFNEGRQAQSYRWLPTAFRPFLENNLRRMEEGFAPDGLFVDVFTAIPPMDFRDRAGRFYSQRVTQEKWGECFDLARKTFGDDAPQLSEAGTDALIGHVDGAQSDHAAWYPPGTPSGEGHDRHFRWNYPAADGERVPWHDMATHGSMVLFAGGLGPRYAGGTDAFLHGYGSDDYLSNTVLGGRNPMCGGPFSRAAVMTYWLLHDLCAQFAKGEMESHEFADGEIHRQIVTFSNGTVAVNRGIRDWTVNGRILPRYGFFAKAAACEASIERRDGVISAFARSPGVLFADARPPSSEAGVMRLRVREVVSEGRQVKVRVAWEVLQASPARFRPFLHFVDEKSTNREIAFQGGTTIRPESFARPETVEATYEARLPEAVADQQRFALRFGFYDPENGERMRLSGARDSEARAKGGSITVVVKGGKPTVQYQAEPDDPNEAASEERMNRSGKIVNFGMVATNGAFRLKYGGESWELVPLPDSKTFEVTLDLAQLGAKKPHQIVGIDAVNSEGSVLGSVAFKQAGSRVQFKTGDAFAYRIRQ